MAEEKLKIFIIDDDSFLSSMYSMKFEKSGFETKVASNGQNAIEVLKGGYKPDVLMMDVVMPIMDGFEMYEQIKKNNLAPNAITVMLTNQGTSVDINRAKELGVNGYIVKATTIPSEVVDEVKSLIKNFKK